MRFLFDPDSLIMRFLSRFADLVILNVIFLLSCLPLFTIGAATTAMYDAVFRMDTEREGKVLPTYFRAFKSNFKQSTRVWLILALLIGATCFNSVYFSNIAGTFGYILFLLSMVVLLNALFIFFYSFPLMSQFDNSIGNTLKNAWILSTAHLPRTVLIAVINCFPVILMYVNLYAFFWLLFLWVFVYFAAAAYFNSRLLMKVFAPLKGEPVPGKEK